MVEIGQDCLLFIKTTIKKYARSATLITIQSCEKLCKFNMHLIYINFLTLYHVKVTRFILMPSNVIH
jgi:hypothetical protein